MEITWYGLGCFRITARNYPAVVTDPFTEEEAERELPHARADIVTSSLPMEQPELARWKGLRGPYRAITGPGEFEIGGMFITGVSTWRDRKKTVENIVYSFELEGLVVCHLGEIGSVPTRAQVEQMGNVHILLLPVGIPGSLTPALASEIISLIEPNLIIPMHYAVPGLKIKREPVDRFLKEMGLTATAHPLPTLKISLSDLKEDTQVILLEPQ